MAKIDAKIEPLSPLVKDRISDLEKSGRAFDLQLGSREHPFRVEACQEGGLTRITLDQSTSSADQSSRDQDAKAAMTDELDQLREIVDYSPLLAWRQHQNGDIVWASKSYFDTFRQMHPEQEQFGWPLPVLMAPPLQVADHNSRSSARVPINFPGNENPAWYEVYSFGTPDQSRLNFALLADPVVKAEEALRNFVQTLTKTFAHLPIGLAIFDKQRKLALFNPALTDLTALKPEWLSQRTTLFGFWDKLRENRHIPEPKDYPSWRRKMVALEESAVSGAYEENWLLPGGQTYRVTGRPHPEGAVAFLFEDISASVSLQQKFRAEMELCQSLIDNLPQAVAVFALGGELTLSNDAFSDLWGSDPSAMLERTNITMTTQLWQSKCLPTQFGAICGILLAWALSAASGPRKFT